VFRAPDSRISQFVLDVRSREVWHRVAELAAFDCQYLEPCVGQLFCENGRRPAEADQNNIDGFELRSHG
jgi:hypothetical protein